MEGQMTLYDLMQPKKVILKGICDDGYCPNCDNCVDYPEENIYAEQCPHCKTYLDWSEWHILNDEWYKEKKENDEN